MVAVEPGDAVTGGPWRSRPGPAGQLNVHETGPPDPGPLVVLCHELPRSRGGAADTGRTMPALAERLKAETGWRVVCANLRGVGGSAGDFSAAGWLEDLGFVLATESGPAEPVCLAGFGLGGALALRYASGDPRVAGVAVFGTPADLSGWVVQPEELLSLCRVSGCVSNPGFPADLAVWSDELVALQPLESAAGMGTRPLLVMHGQDDPDIPTESARQLARAASGAVDLRILIGAGHWLQADPRVVATLIGWLERQV